MYTPITLVDGSGELQEAQRIYASKPIMADAVRMGAVAGAVKAAATFLNDVSVASAVSDALDNAASDADTAIRAWADNNETGKCYDPAQVGALIQVLLTRPENWPDPRPISFQSVFVASCDLNATDALNKYLATASMFEGPPEGTEQLFKFIWRTLD
ncbi:MAG: hypothetical protein JOZ29_07585 [Deltaproteobacteria bacterium]|nr:hypothetical protein [Deltaproteobacteria bacterium]